MNEISHFDKLDFFQEHPDVVCHPISRNGLEVGEELHVLLRGEVPPQDIVLGTHPQDGVHCVQVLADT